MNAAGREGAPPRFGVTLEMESEDGRWLERSDGVSPFFAGLAELLEMVVERQVEHQFEPYGVSCVAQTESGRIAIHTWPECRTATVDIWTSTRLSEERLAGFRGWLALHHGCRILALRTHGRV